MITPTASSTAQTGNFFATEDFDTPPPAVPAPVVVPRRQSAASQLFASYQDDEPATPKTPATPQPQYDPWATTAQVAPLVPVAAAPPAPAPALIDIFGDDLLLPAGGQSHTAPPSAAPTPSGKPRNALDLLSLYDQPLTPAPKNAMMGSSPSMGNGLSMGMSPMSMGAPSPMGFRQAGVPMQPMQPMGGGQNTRGSFIAAPQQGGLLQPNHPQQGVYGQQQQQPMGMGLGAQQPMSMGGNPQMGMGMNNNMNNAAPRASFNAGPMAMGGAPNGNMGAMGGGMQNTRGSFIAANPTPGMGYGAPGQGLQPAQPPKSSLDTLDWNF